MQETGVRGRAVTDRPFFKIMLCKELSQSGHEKGGGAAMTGHVEEAVEIRG
jgi:hypothetical protein